jgi:hypothetical protein
MVLQGKSATQPPIMALTGTTILHSSLHVLAFPSTFSSWMRTKWAFLNFFPFTTYKIPLLNGVAGTAVFADTNMFVIV